MLLLMFFCCLFVVAVVVVLIVVVVVGCSWIAGDVNPSRTKFERSEKKKEASFNLARREGYFGES